MRRFSMFLLAAGLVVGASCSKKDSGKPATGSGSSAGAGASGGAGNAGSSGGSAAVVTAEGGGVTDLPVVTDCPKSLGGGEKVARTIKKECGPIVVTGEYAVNGSLTLEAGVVLKFQPDASLEVGYSGPAKLIIKGGDAPDQRVKFTSAGDPAAGIWKGVSLYDGADRSSITGLDIEFAGTDDHPAVLLQSAIDVTWTKNTVKHAKGVGLIGKGESTFAAFTGNTFDDVRLAMTVEPGAVGGLGAGNTFAKDAFIEVGGGKVHHDATWHNAGAPYHVTAEIDVESASTPTTLTIADATLAFAPDVEFAIGYGSKGKLVVTGPAVFTSVDGKPGTWKGLRVYDNGDATIDNATISSGGADEAGALQVKGAGKLTLGTVTFSGNKTALSVEAAATLVAPKPLTFTSNERAARLTPAAFGGLAGANVYDDGEIVEITGGKLVADTTWSVQPKAAVQVSAEIQIGDNHTLTIAAGSTLAFKTGVEFAIGYGSIGTLKAIGTAAAPITLAALTKGDQWNGLRLYDQARAVELTQVVLADVAGDGAILAKGGSVGKLDHVSSTGCAATIFAVCEAKVDTSTAVTAGAGTKVAVKKPDGCP